MALAEASAAPAFMVGGCTLGGWVTPSAMTATQEQTAPPMLSAAATSAAHAMQLVQLALGLAPAVATPALLAGGCTMDGLATTARTATPMQIARWQTHTAACQPMSVTTAMLPVPPVLGQTRAAVRAATQATRFKVSLLQAVWHLGNKHN